MTGAKRFLLVMWEGGGTVPPELGVARQLIARGHSVRVLADPTIEPEARVAGCEFSPWTTAPHRTSRDRSADIIKDYETSNPLQMIDKYMKEFLGDPAPRWAADTFAELQQRPVDMFITDQALPAATIAAERLGLPTAALSPQIWMMPTPGIPPLGPGFAPARGPIGWMRDAALRTITTRLFNKALPALNAARASYGLQPVRSTHEQMLRVDATYVLTSPVFDFTSPALPKNVFFAGPVLDDPVWSEPWRSPWSPGDLRPLVLVGFSSAFQNQAEVMQRTVDALVGLPVRAVVTLGNCIPPDEVRGAENVRVVRSAPHAPILREASLLITHCGHGTTMKGLAAGVPLLCLPMGRDQNDIAARVVHHGAGLRLSPKAPSAKIRSAVETLLRDDRYRAGAQRIARAIANREGCVDIVTSLETLAATTGMPAEARSAEAVRAAAYAS
jgi:MGT family glycosyltransferase